MTTINFKILMVNCSTTKVPVYHTEFSVAGTGSFSGSSTAESERVKQVGHHSSYVGGTEPHSSSGGQTAQTSRHSGKFPP